MRLKKAAMFGLDARIALAIFGALSVISGAALYTAIQRAQVVSVLADLKEVGKAWEQYYLDTGIAVSKIEDLQNDSNSHSGWDGPYLPYDTAGRNISYGRYESSNVLINKARGDSTNWDIYANSRDCVVNVSCILWASFTKVPEQIAIAMDKMVDGTEDATNGNFRWVKGGFYELTIYLNMASADAPTS